MQPNGYRVLAEECYASETTGHDLSRPVQAAMTAPLRLSLRKDVHWVWPHKQVWPLTHSIRCKIEGF